MEEVIIIGAGAAGLAAAKRLHEAKVRFKILEARGRIGGRAHTLPGKIPIELGPEFLHGRTKITDQILSDLGLSSMDVPDQHLFKMGRRFKKAEEFWDELTAALKKIPKLKKDASLGEVLRGMKKVSDQDKQLVRSFLQGFDAVLINEVSAQEMLGTLSQVEDPKERKAGRTLGGYSEMLEDYSREFAAKIFLNAEVRTVEWSKNAVKISYFDKKLKKIKNLSAKKLILTLPVGVWQADPASPGHVAFTPPLYSKAEALAGLGMGPVLKIVLKFKRDFWSKNFAEPIAMLHTPKEKFQTWWTAAPMRWPLITAWSGGDPVLELAKLSLKEREASVLKEFAAWANVPLRQVQSELEKIYMHDWDDDPYARGAYSFVKVGGEDARTKLGRSVLHTLYFAGEATSTERNGTIEGALESGQRVAGQILSDLNRRAPH